MIQTKMPIIYEDRGDGMSIVRIDIPNYTITRDGYELLVNDWINVNGEEICHRAKVVYYDNDKINAISSYVDANYDLTGLSKTQKDWKKVQLGLMFDTQTNLLSGGTTIYRIQPEDWEFTPQPV